MEQSQLNRRAIDRREFAALLPALIAAAALAPEAHAQQPSTAAADNPVPGKPTPGIESVPKPLPELVSGVYTPSAPYGSAPGRKSQRYLAGILKAGNIQTEMHETHQEVGAVHEAVGKHLHSEIWFVKEGVCELMTNGVIRRMGPGDVGLCCAGDLHYVANAGNTPCTYFVVTVGPPEP
jgi:mannose-6-phosphate isomerase-like protein (cupin superfamily)